MLQGCMPALSHYGLLWPALLLCLLLCYPTPRTLIPAGAVVTHKPLLCLLPLLLEASSFCS